MTIPMGAVLHFGGPLSKSRRRLRLTRMNTLNFAARLASAAAISYQALLVLLIFLRPDLNPSWHTISEWAIGRYGWS